MIVNLADGQASTRWQISIQGGLHIIIVSIIQLSLLIPMQKTQRRIISRNRVKPWILPKPIEFPTESLIKLSGTPLKAWTLNIPEQGEQRF